MRLRVRPAYTDEQLAEMYFEPPVYAWRGHAERMRFTADVGGSMWTGGLVADLSAGTAEITTLMGVPDDKLILGDLVAGYEYEGPIEETVHKIPPVELFVCCETLEHLDDPDLVLRAIRGKCDRLLITTPDSETKDNPEHYWTWDGKGVRKMLVGAGFKPIYWSCPEWDGFRFQVWGCE